MPKKKPELIDKYREWHGRPVPTFDVLDDDTLMDSDNDDDDIGTDNVEIEINEIDTAAV